MNWRGKGGAVAVAVGALAMLSGCASSIAERSYEGMPAGSRPLNSLPPTPGRFDLPDPDLAPRVQWADGRDLLAVSLWGGSSCPVEPTGVHELGRDRLEVAVTRRQGWFGACTADLTVNTYEVRIPGSVSQSSPLTVVVDGHEFTLDSQPAP